MHAPGIESDRVDFGSVSAAAQLLQQLARQCIVHAAQVRKGRGQEAHVKAQDCFQKLKVGSTAT